MFPPDKKLYPSYDDWLETSMRAEPVEYFREMLAKNLPIEGFLDSDWTMANARLCDFYGLPEPKTGGFQRVSLKPEEPSRRLLTMGAVLGLTSDGTRHRPVHRGVWVSEAIFNKTPPPPPANVDPIEPIPPKGTKITIRQRIEAHAKNASCAACHRNIDPLGWPLTSTMPSASGGPASGFQRAWVKIHWLMPPASCPTAVRSPIPPNSNGCYSRTVTRSRGPSSNTSAPTRSAACSPWMTAKTISS